MSSARSIQTLTIRFFWLFSFSFYRDFYNLRPVVCLLA